MVMSVQFPRFSQSVAPPAQRKVSFGSNKLPYAPRFGDFAGDISNGTIERFARFLLVAILVGGSLLTGAFFVGRASSSSNDELSPPTAVEKGTSDSSVN